MVHAPEDSGPILTLNPFSCRVSFAFIATSLALKGCMCSSSFLSFSFLTHLLCQWWCSERLVAVSQVLRLYECLKSWLEMIRHTDCSQQQSPAHGASNIWDISISLWVCLLYDCFPWWSDHNWQGKVSEGLLLRIDFSSMQQCKRKKNHCYFVHTVMCSYTDQRVTG